jgi:tetraacyldisaccharide 4'-kinase
MDSGVKQVLLKAWLRRGWLAYLLWPLAQIHGLLVRLRRALYRRRILSSERFSVPVIVVGNVVAGGAGKTPLVMALVKHLQAQGLQVGVVARGYGRSGHESLEVRPDTPVYESGDEPALIQRATGAPVFVANKRVEAVRDLLTAYPAIAVVVCDDGLQHYALQRDIEIAVFDDRGIGNGWLLPAGPLREPWPRRVDLVLRPPGAEQIAGHAVARTLADTAVRADGTRLALGTLRGQRLHAVAGIANPEVFFGMLRAAGLELSRTSALPDHHAFADAAGLDPAATLLCTEKDAVKLWRLRPDAWAVPLQLRIEPAFWESLDHLLDAKLSSAHGSTTA